MSSPPSDQRAPAAWIEARVLAPAAQAEAAAAELWSLTGRGVITEEPRGAGGPVLVRGFIAAGPEAPAQRAAVEALAARLGETASPEPVTLSFSELPDQDWHSSWKRHFHPKEVVPGLVVGPSWEPAATVRGQKSLLIDPGQAFGTGQHESTVLCLRRLARLAEAGRLDRPVLDVGCGTGILALAALALGAPRALGIDIDPEALLAAEKNAVLNKMADNLTFSAVPLAELPERFALVLANLTAADLVHLAEPLAAHLSPGGELVCSGLLREQAGEVRAALEAHGLALAAEDAMGEWASLVFS